MHARFLPGSEFVGAEALEKVLQHSHLALEVLRRAQSGPAPLRSPKRVLRKKMRQHAPAEEISGGACGLLLSAEKNYTRWFAVISASHWLQHARN